MEATIICNGAETSAPVLAPQLHTTLALVDINVIQRLASMLPTVPFYQIKDDVVARLRNCDKLDDMLHLMEDELAFHLSVNLITEYKMPVSNEAYAGEHTT